VLLILVIIIKKKKKNAKVDLVLGKKKVIILVTKKNHIKTRGKMGTDTNTDIEALHHKLIEIEVIMDIEEIIALQNQRKGSEKKKKEKEIKSIIIVTMKKTM
jgi:hypothetical protein